MDTGDGSTPLHDLALNPSGAASADLADALVAAGADVAALTGPGHAVPATAPLHLAAAAGGRRRPELFDVVGGPYLGRCGA